MIWSLRLWAARFQYGAICHMGLTEPQACLRLIARVDGICAGLHARHDANQRRLGPRIPIRPMRPHLRIAIRLKFEQQFPYVTRSRPPFRGRGDGFCKGPGGIDA